MRVLVTGGAGFIGSWVCERLRARGDAVMIIDDFNDFYDPRIKRERARLLEQEGCTVVEGDILDPGALRRAFTPAPDAVVHLAAYAGVRPSLQRPALYQRVNVEGTARVLEACVCSGVNRLVFASSSSVYGGRTDVPFRETDDVTAPISPYAASKVAGEILCRTWHHLYDLSVFCLRFFTVFGPRQRPEMAIASFAEKIATGEEVPVFGDGSDARDYTYVDDIVDGVVAAVDRCHGFAVLNLGQGTTTSLTQLVQYIGDALGKRPVVRHLPRQPGDVPITCADIGAARAILGYAPRVSVAEGIARYCAWRFDTPQ